MIIIVENYELSILDIIFRQFVKQLLKLDAKIVKSKVHASTNN